MSNDYTTLLAIKEHNPCKDGWVKLLKHLGKTRADDEPLSFATILESNGLEDAIWSLRTYPDQSKVALLSCDYAEHVLHVYENEFPGETAPRNTIETARKYINGEASYEELENAMSAAYAAAEAAYDIYAAYAAAYAVADAATRVADAADAAYAADDAYAAAYAAYAAAEAADDNYKAEREWQIELFKKYFC